MDQHGPKIDERNYQNGLKIYQNVSKMGMDQQIIKNYQKKYLKNTKNCPIIYQNRQNMDQNEPKVDQKWTKNGPKTDQQIINNYQKITKKLPNIYQNRQNMTDVRADVRADVLNPMFIRCSGFNTIAELIHL